MATSSTIPSPTAPATLETITGLVTEMRDEFGIVKEDILFKNSTVVGQLPSIGDRVVVEVERVEGLLYKFNAKRVEFHSKDILSPEDQIITAPTPKLSTPSTNFNSSSAIVGGNAAPYIGLGPNRRNWDEDRLARLRLEKKALEEELQRKIELRQRSKRGASKPQPQRQMESLRRSKRVLKRTVSDSEQEFKPRHKIERQQIPKHVAKRAVSDPKPRRSARPNKSRNSKPQRSRFRSLSKDRLSTNVNRASGPRLNPYERAEARRAAEAQLDSVREVEGEELDPRDFVQVQLPDQKGENEKKAHEGDEI